ncbi:hypothetical protein P3X46_013314 [Hevea brasiliensis]|uniref:Uncharacterized protein n=1 Tax=Hevea brasiliensis TaxID=3981 RepID=A0ABQ9M734_HEVBR|nr:uncharacterized protein LOC110653885 [Hevea brasiliensis]KAJ9174698.1 hypothetical protein P3X46_013314 [Hevea brasiliensis]
MQLAPFALSLWLLQPPNYIRHHPFALVAFIGNFTDCHGVFSDQHELLLHLLCRTSSSRQVSSIQLARTKMAFPHNEVELSIVGAATSYVNNVRNTVTALVLFLVQLHSSFFEDMK